MSAEASRLAEVRAHIATAAQAVGRDPAGVTLVAVSKMHGADSVRALLDVGGTLGLGAMTELTLGYQGALGGRANDHAIRLLGVVKL